MSTLDYTLIGLYLGAILTVGMILGTRASKDIESYFLGGRSMPWWALGASGMASNLDVSGTMIIVAFLYAVGAQDSSSRSAAASLVFVTVGVLFSYGVRNINDIWGWLTMSIGAGLVVPLFLRWYWWRVNGYGFAAGTFAGMLAAVVQKLAFPLIPEYAAFVSVSSISAAALLLTSLVTGPTADETLLQFYSVTRPFGFWKPVRLRLTAEVRQSIRREHLRDLLALAAAVPWQLVLFVFMHADRHEAMAHSGVAWSAAHRPLLHSLEPAVPSVTVGSTPYRGTQPTIMKTPACLLTTVGLVVSVILLGCQTPREPTREVRGVWLTNVDSRVLESREAIADAMQFLADHHFNVVFPVVWNKGFTMYPSVVMDSLFSVPVDPLYGNRDPLAELIEEAHARNLSVIPWFEFGFSASHKKSSRHILKRKPEWAARNLQGEILTKNGFDWMNAYHPEVQEFLRSLLLEVVRNYDVDGIQGDDRLPAQPVEGGYSAFTTGLYRSEHGGASPPDDLRDAEWVRWRAAMLSTFARELYQEAKGLKPDIIVSWAPSIFPWALEEYLQDWPAWINEGSADLVIPQVYRYSFEEYQTALVSQAAESLGVKRDDCLIVPGMLLSLGEYDMSQEYLNAALDLHRLRGYKGEVYFFYEGLRNNNDRVATYLLSTYYADRALLPFLTRFSP